MTKMSKEEVKEELEKDNFYFNPESSTGMNHQVRVTAQNNAIIYLTQELNKNIKQLQDSIDKHGEEIKKYEEANSKSTKWMSLLTCVMTFLVLVQVALMLNQIFKWW